MLQLCGRFSKALGSYLHGADKVDGLRKRVAILTDATSPGESFPYWLRYYAEQFGSENLFVVTYRALGPLFQTFKIGGLLELEFDYSNDVRRTILTQLADEMLKKYDVVVRCDVDEFLIANPLLFDCLSAYVDALDVPHVTAFGMDIFQDIDEPALQMDGRPLLAQRRYCVATTSLCKTAIVTKPVAWSIGFHYSDAPPHLANLFLLHMKFADVGRRVTWFDHMRSLSGKGSFEDERFADGAYKLEPVRRHMISLPRRPGWSNFVDTSFVEQHLTASRSKGDKQRFYSFPFEIDDHVREMPPQIRDWV